MITYEYTYKKQGNGTDSWIRIILEDGIEISRDMVYENPFKTPDKIVLDLVKNMSPEAISELKLLLK